MPNGIAVTWPKPGSRVACIFRDADGVEIIRFTDGTEMPLDVAEANWIVNAG